MKYKVGDKVKIKDGLVPNGRYGRVMFTEVMADFQDDIMTVIRAHESLYILSNGKSDSLSEMYLWSDQMLVPAVDNSECYCETLL